MLMILSRHSWGPGELNDTPRSHSTSQARPTVLLPISSLPLLPPGSGVTWHFRMEPKGFFPLE